MKLVICDLGGVVCRNSDVLPTIARRFNMSPEEFCRRMAKELELLYRGKILAREFWRIFSQKTGCSVHGDPWEEDFSPVIDREVLQSLAGIRRKVRVVAGTNTIASHYKVLERMGLFANFDAVYASHELGLAKPEPDFYRAILRKEGMAARETLFVDDMQVNVEGAKRLGLRSVRFKDVADLWLAFEDLGLIGPRGEDPP